MDRYPSAAGQSLAVLTSLHRGTRELAIVGNRATEMRSVFWKRYRPHVALGHRRSGTGGEPVPLLEGGIPGSGTLAYLCTGFACLAPVDSIESLAALLDKRLSGQPHVTDPDQVGHRQVEEADPERAAEGDGQQPQPHLARAQNQEACGPGPEPGPGTSGSPMLPPTTVSHRQHRMEHPQPAEEMLGRA